jgi:hypothetical protein
LILWRIGHPRKGPLEKQGAAPVGAPSAAGAVRQ